MKTKSFLLCLLLAISANAQIVYHDASAFPLLGKATETTLTRYERLPDSLRNISRKPLWELGRNSAGLAVRFRSNSTRIAAKWEVLLNRNMNHMTPTVKDMLPEEREYLLFLSLYDGVTSLSIGIDSLSQISGPATELPVRKKPVVFYGTSILQGGCASRPGMAHTNILERWLNRECINLGFSGNALLDLEIAHVMAGVDASVFVLDFVPNASVEQIQERAGAFYSIIRSKHPDTPVLFVEDPIFTHSRFNRTVAREVKDKNETLQAVFQSLKKRGEKNIYLLSSEDIIGHDGEATVDGVHFTDLGFMRYAEVLYPVLKKHMKE